MADPQSSIFVEDDSDSDAVSLNSTVASEQLEEYNVEKILHEVEIDGRTHYLAKWEGYPVNRSTYEPREFG